jgi:hypothetical protein
VIFPSVEFALFFPLVLTLSWLLMPHPRLWKPFVLAASYAFYMAASWKFGVLRRRVASARRRVTRGAGVSTAGSG